MSRRTQLTVPSPDRKGDEGMVSVEIALGIGVRESARGGNGMQAAQAVGAGLSNLHFEFSSDERWIYGSAESSYRGPAGVLGFHAHCRYQGLRESTLVGGED